MSQSIVKIAQSTGIPGHDKLHITSIVLATAEERARTPSLMNAVIDIRSESTSMFFLKRLYRQLTSS